eukprot:6849-Rhodomonas_salina.9
MGKEGLYRCIVHTMELIGPTAVAQECYAEAEKHARVPTVGVEVVLQYETASVLSQARGVRFEVPLPLCSYASATRVRCYRTILLVGQLGTNAGYAGTRRVKWRRLGGPLSSISYAVRPFVPAPRSCRCRTSYRPTHALQNVRYSRQYWTGPLWNERY